MNPAPSRPLLRPALLALLFLGCLFLQAACSDEPFGDHSSPGLVGRDNSLTDPNATPPPEASTPTPYP
ncbi:MAG: hypothetical protein ABI946_03980 [Chthoniobacterales bacterium]